MLEGPESAQADGKSQPEETSRRMGSSGSPQWSRMLDAAETILCEEGYAALTSRRVAEHVGVKQRLVYYYFRTMDELVVETFRRTTSREMDRLEQASIAPQAVRAFWTIATQTSDPRLISEFMALANRNAALKVEVIAFIEISRKMQVAALARAIAAHPQSGNLSAEAVAVIATSLALALGREAALGVDAGHAQITRLVSDFLDRIAP